MNKTQAIVVDDHPILREGLCLLLKQVPDLEIVGVAGDGRAAVELVRQHAPDLVVMDVSMSGLNGIEATRQIVAIDSSAKVIGLSAHADTRFVLGMLEAGASAYVHKATSGHELVQAIAAVRRGQRYLSPEITRLVVDGYLHQPDTQGTTRVSPLGAREREVLQLVAEGKSSKEIAVVLSISTRTVEVHRRHIMAKLDLHSSAELTKYAVREGLTSLEA